MMIEKTEKPKHLGRGLASLLGPITTTTEESPLPIPIAEINANILSNIELHSSFREIKVDEIETNPHQVRSFWNEKELAELAQSIKANGVIQPVIVRTMGS